MPATDTEKRRPRVFRTVCQAWCSVGSALLQMPLAFLLTIVASVLLSAALLPLQNKCHLTPAQSDELMAGRPVGTAMCGTLLPFVSLILKSLILAPLAIAIHRFVLLGERTPLLPLAPVQRILRFAGWVVAVKSTLILPVLLIPFSPLAFNFFGTVIVCVGTVVTVRLVLVFPTIAIGMSGYLAQRSFRQTRWQFWRIISVLIITVLPVYALALLAVLLTWQISTEITFQAILESPLFAVVSVLSVTVAAAAASWLFLDYGDAHGQPRTVPGQVAKN